MIDLKFRKEISRAVDPIGRGLVRVGLTANRLTMTGLAGAFVAAWFAIRGQLFLAGVAGTVASLFDLLDGPAAKAAGRPSRRGAYLDSMTDRVSESVMYAALVVYCIDFRSTRVAYVVVAAYMGAQLTSYARAKADALGIDGKAGFMERAERQLTLGVAALVPGAFVPAIIFLAVGACVTALHRMVVIWVRVGRAEGIAGRLSRPRHSSRPRRRRRLARR